jgi:molecular chaperone GrpE
MSEDLTREEVLRRFAELLDGALAAETPLPGVDPQVLAEDNSAPDSYALWAAMTTLAQEVKLQGRAFKDLNDQMRAATSDREREIRSEAERGCRKEALGVLVDLRDRVGRGIESVRIAEAEIAKRASAGWLARMLRKRDDGHAAVLAALKKGYELALDRLDQALEDHGAREIRCLGEAFDPRRMNAIDKEESAAFPEGTVLEVFRSGYEWNGEVFRTAQVKVSCAPVAEKPPAAQKPPATQKPAAEKTSE